MSEIVLVIALLVIAIAVVFMIMSMYSREAEKNLKSNVSDRIMIYDDLIEDRFLYNRCHVIGYLLCGDNSTP